MSLGTISASINMTELVAALSDSNGDGAWLQETFPAWLKEVVTHLHIDIVGAWKSAFDWSFRLETIRE